MSFLLVDWQCPSPRWPSPAFLQSGLLLPMLHAEMPDAIRKTKRYISRISQHNPISSSLLRSQSGTPFLQEPSHPFVLGCGVKKAPYEHGTGTRLSYSISPSRVFHSASLFKRQKVRNCKMIQAGKSPNAVFINYRIEKNSKNREERMLGDRKKKQNKQESHKMGGKSLFPVTHR